jgi:hypothetical protein
MGGGASKKKAAFFRAQQMTAIAEEAEYAKYGPQVEARFRKDGESGLIGIKLDIEYKENESGDVTLVGFNRSEDGRSLPAQSSKKLEVGDVILGVDKNKVPLDKKLDRQDLRTIAEWIRNSSNAFVFLTYRPLKEPRERSDTMKTKKEPLVADILRWKKGNLKKKPMQIVNVTAMDSWDITMANISRGSHKLMVDECTNHFPRIFRYNKKSRKTIIECVCEEGYLEALAHFTSTNNRAAGQMQASHIPFLKPRANSKQKYDPFFKIFTPPQNTVRFRDDPMIRKEGDDLDGQKIMKPGDEEDRTEMLNIVCEYEPEVLDLTHGVCDHTAMQYTCIWGWGAATKVLMDHGASFLIPNCWGMTPLFFACKYGYINCVKAIVEHRRYRTHFISMRPNPALPPKPQRGLMGVCAITIAAKGGFADIVLFLVENGFDLNVCEDDGSTAMRLACMGAGEKIHPNNPEGEEMPWLECVRILATAGVHFIQQAVDSVRQEQDAAGHEFRRSRVQKVVDEVKKIKSDNRADLKASKRAKILADRKAKEQLMAQDQSDTQGDWTRYKDPYSGGREYFFNKVTDESSWDPPSSWLQDKTAEYCDQCHEWADLTMHGPCHFCKSKWLHRAVNTTAYQAGLEREAKAKAAKKHKEGNYFEVEDITKFTIGKLTKGLPPRGRRQGYVVEIEPEVPDTEVGCGAITIQKTPIEIFHPSQHFEKVGPLMPVQTIPTLARGMPQPGSLCKTVGAPWPNVDDHWQPIRYGKKAQSLPC